MPDNKAKQTATRARLLVGLILLYCLSVPLALFIWLSGLAPLSLSNSAVNWVYSGGLVAPFAALLAKRLNRRAVLRELGLPPYLFNAILWLSVLPMLLAVGSWIVFYFQNQG